jgi:hypothetical protein
LSGIMKKLIASFAVFIYLAFVTGVMVNHHFCMDRYDSVNFYKTASDWCGTCGMHTQNKGCCHDEITILKLQDDHKTSSFGFELKNLEPVVTDLPEFIALEISNDRSVDHLNHSPPLLTPPHIYLENRVFRI